MRIIGNSSVLLTAFLLAYPAHADEKVAEVIDVTPKTKFTAVELPPWADFDFSKAGKLPMLAYKSHTFEGVPFTLQSTGMRLRGEYFPEDPTRVQGINIGRSIRQLHVLHATEHGGRGHRITGHTDYVKDGTLIGQYHVLYADGLIEVIPIVYGEDVRDWWDWDSSKPCKRSKVAWESENHRNIKIRLYLTSWINPRPNKQVASITMVSTADTAASPFCVAMTTEDVSQ